MTIRDSGEIRAGPHRQWGCLTEGISPTGLSACCSRPGSGRVFLAPGVGMGVKQWCIRVEFSPGHSNRARLRGELCEELITMSRCRSARFSAVRQAPILNLRNKELRYLRMMININQHSSGNTRNSTVPTGTDICKGQWMRVAPERKFGTIIIKYYLTL